MHDDGELVPLSEIETPEEKALTAYKYRVAGFTWNEVANKVGYPSADAARVDVRTYMQKAAMDLEKSTRLEGLQTEIDRLDELQTSVWGMAVTGDLKAVDTILKIIAMRSRLMGLEQIYNEGDGKTTTIVVPMESNEYVRTLKKISGLDSE